MSLNTIRHSALGTNCSARFAVFAVMMVCFGVIATARGQCNTPWVRVPRSGDWPSPRGAFSMSYDAARDRIVIFGARASNSHGYLDDTWEFDGTQWAQRSPPNPRPAARYLASMQYDPVSSRTLLFGGYNGNSTYFHEMWAWDGSMWQLRSTGGPSATYANFSCFDGAGHRMLVYGGEGIGTFRRELWAFNPTNDAWTMLDPNGPFNGGLGAMYYNPVFARPQLAGGVTGTNQDLNTQYVWQGPPNGWTAGSLAPWMARRAMAPCQSSTSGFIVGGYFAEPIQQIFSDAWQLDFRTGTWVPLPSLPRGVAHASCVYDSLRHRLVLFGGYINQILTQDLDEMWVLPVFCPADINCDGVGNSQDFFAFLGFFFGNLPEADFNHDGTITSQDFFDFLAAFFSGC